MRCVMCAMKRRPVRAVDLLGDIQKGKLYSEILARFGLKPAQFRPLFEELLADHLLSPGDLCGESSLDDPDTVDEFIFDPTNRIFERLDITYPLPVINIEKGVVAGHALNLSKWGLKISGIISNMGDLQAFVIPSNKRLNTTRVEMEAICRWKGVQFEDLTPVAGYEALTFFDGSFDALLSELKMLSSGQMRSITEDDWSKEKPTTEQPKKKAQPDDEEWVFEFED